MTTRAKFWLSLAVLFAVLYLWNEFLRDAWEGLR